MKQVYKDHFFYECSSNWTFEQLKSAQENLKSKTAPFPCCFSTILCDTAYLFTAVMPMFQELISFWFIDLQNAIL